MKKSPEQILLEHARSMIANSNISQANFIHDLLLPQLIEEGLEKPEDHKTADEYETWRSAKVRQINSIINGHTNVPLRWLWVWLKVLPKPYGSAARKEILSQAGVIDVSLTCLNAPTAKRSDLPNLFREVADVMEKGAVVAADGIYDHTDDPSALMDLSNELMDVLELCINEIHCIDKAVSLEGTRAGVVVSMLKSTK